MNEIKDLINQWEEQGLLNPDGIDKLYQAILLLIEEIEKLK